MGKVKKKKMGGTSSVPRRLGAYSVYKERHKEKEHPVPLSKGKKKKSGRKLEKCMKTQAEAAVLDAGASTCIVEMDSPMARSTSTFAKTFFKKLEGNLETDADKAVPFIKAEHSVSKRKRGKQNEGTQTRFIQTDAGSLESAKKLKNQRKKGRSCQIQSDSLKNSKPSPDPPGCSQSSKLEFRRLPAKSVVPCDTTPLLKSAVSDTQTTGRFVAHGSSDIIVLPQKEKSFHQEMGGKRRKTGNNSIVDGARCEKTEVHETCTSSVPPLPKKKRKNSRNDSKCQGLTLLGHGPVEIKPIQFEPTGSVKNVGRGETAKVNEDDSTQNDVKRDSQYMEMEDQVGDDSARYAPLNSECIFPSPEEDRVYLVFRHPSEICLRGRYTVEALTGCVQILGYEIKPNGQHYEVYSPDNSSQLVINSTETYTASLEDARTALVSKVESEDILRKICGVLSESSSVVCVGRLDSVVCEKVGSVNPFHYLFPRGGYSADMTDFGDIGATLARKDSRKCVISSEFAEVAERITSAIVEDSGTAPVVVLCGGKNVGKSTFARFLINSALNSCDRVGYLECDVGQTEFTPPGCVAFNIISQPLLGPPFTHQRDAECMYYIGAASPGDNPGFYIDCVEKVFGTYHSIIPRIPLIVNTMGWTQGMGVSLLMDTLRIVKPTVLVQLQSDSNYRNYPPLTVEYVSGTPGWKYTDSSGTDHEHFVVQSLTDITKDGMEKYKAADHRDLAVLAYFSRVLPPEVSLLNIHCVKPYKLKWSAVAVHVANVVVPQSQIMYALNATMVALCHADKSLIVDSSDASLPKFFRKMPICDCIGFGLIRGIDPIDKLFYIITPVSKNKLHLVNAIIKGAVTIPKQLLLSKKKPDVVPYIDNPKGVTGVQPVGRRFMARKSPHRGKKL